MNDLSQITPEQLRTWLTRRVAFYLDRADSDIDPDTDLARYGLDSVYTMSVISDVEDYLQIELDLANTPRSTIADLTDYLIELV